MELNLGKFYTAKDGAIWCCFRVDNKAPSHASAYCIRVEDSRVEYFYLDGRYDEAGKSNNCLISEIKYDN